LVWISASTCSISSRGTSLPFPLPPLLASLTEEDGRTAYDDMDFLNLWFKVIQAMISDEFEDHIGEIFEDVIPNMLSIAEVHLTLSLSLFG
jgi:hypothetical protein